MDAFYRGHIVQMINDSSKMSIVPEEAEGVIIINIVVDLEC